MQSDKKLIEHCERLAVQPGTFEAGAAGLNKALHWISVRDEALKDAAARLRELTAEPKAVKVKPLEWEETWSGHYEDIPSWRGRNPLGFFVDISFAGEYKLKKHADAPAEKLAERKAAAQANYERRILSALEPVTAEPDEAMGHGYRVLDRLIERWSDPKLKYEIVRNMGTWTYANVADYLRSIRAALARNTPVVGTEPTEARAETVSPSDPMTIIAGIKQFGLAADGSDLRDLEAALAAVPRREGWQPIETAPKDGTRVLLWAKEWTGPCTGQYYEEPRGWGAFYDIGMYKYQPTHWMPLPAAPQEGEQ